MLLGAWQSGIKARVKQRPVTGTKEFQGPGSKWTLIGVGAAASVPLFLLTLLSLAPAGQPPSSQDYVVLMWLSKAGLYAPCLSNRTVWLHCWPLLNEYSHAPFTFVFDTSPRDCYLSKFLSLPYSRFSHFFFSTSSTGSAAVSSHITTIPAVAVTLHSFPI